MGGAAGYETTRRGAGSGNETKEQVAYRQFPRPSPLPRRRGYARLTYLRAHVGGARKERGSGKNTYGGQRLRRNVGGTNQIADRVIGHQRSCEYHAVCVFSPKQRC